MSNANKRERSLHDQFLDHLRAVSQGYRESDIFRDACRCMAIALASPLLKGDEKQRIEDEYQSYVEKYGKSGIYHISDCFKIVVDALEARRHDFLGHIMEEIGAANTRGTAQYLTPDSVAHLMARVTIPSKPEHGKILTLNDPAAGAGSLLIETAEEFIQNGGRQADILIHAQDLDFNAFNISYIQLTLLGYPAVVTRMNTLSMEVIEGPWYTMGYFAHGMPMRLAAEPANRNPLLFASEQSDQPSCREDLKSEAVTLPPHTTQPEFDLGSV